jgi:WD40 repeat protein
MKSVQFSPDGHHLLSTTESNEAIVCAVSAEAVHLNGFYMPNTPKNDSDSSGLKLEKLIRVGEAIHDAKWYPHMRLDDPSTHCFVTTSRDHPILLWDVASSSVRCSYSGYDHVDELDSAVCLTFNASGDKLYAGYNRMIR